MSRISIKVKTPKLDNFCSTMMHDNDSSASGYVVDAFEGISQTFTDIEILTISDVNVVAKAKRYGRWWLLKGLRREVAKEAGYQQRLRKEFEILMQLQHPNVVTAYSMEDVEGLGQCIVMEYVDGPTLKEWLDGKPTRKLRLAVAYDMMDAVAYIHAKGIVHRDLKPENTIVTQNGSNVKLIDFGLADTDSHAILKQPAGTPKYMSPEQMQTAVADVRNDIYSLGVILKQMNLGLRYHYIINRCMLPIDRRYQNASELLNQIHSVDGYIKKFIIAFILLLAVVLLLLTGYQITKTSEEDERLTQFNSLHSQELRAQQQQIAELTDTIIKLKADNTLMKEREAAIEARRKRVKDAIEKGNALVDKTTRQTNIDQHLDTLSNIVYLRHDFSEESMSGYRTIVTYLEKIKAQYNDAEMAEIKDAMNLHCAAIIEKWNKKMKRLLK